MARPSPTWFHLCTTVKGEGCHGRTLMPLTLVLTSGVMTVSLRSRNSKTLRRPVVGDTWWHQIRTKSPIFMLMFCLPGDEPQAFGHTGPEPQTLSTNILLLQKQLIVINPNWKACFTGAPFFISSSILQSGVAASRSLFLLPPSNLYIQIMGEE